MQVGPPPAGSVIEDERRWFDHAACCIWLVLCQISIDWYGGHRNTFGGPRMWSAPEGGLPCQGKSYTR